MKKLISSVTKVIKSLVKNRCTFESTDNCEDNLEYHEIEGFDITVCDDNEREQWIVYLENVKNSGGNQISHEEFTTLLKGTLGPVSKEVVRTDLPHTVNNWKPSKNLLIVHEGDSMYFIQEYTKR